MSCTCKRCGQKYKVDFLVPDRLWYQIKPDIGNLLCGPCIAQAIEDMDEYGAYHISEDAPKSPDMNGEDDKAQGRKSFQYNRSH